MTARTHQTLFDSTTGVNAFALISDAEGVPLNVNTAAQAVNPSWPAYETICVETTELFPALAAGGASHQSWVLRAQVRCCCAGACAYSADHPAQNAYAAVSTAPASPASQPQTKHGPAQGYVESMLPATALSALAGQATSAMATAAARTALAVTLSADATKFSLTAAQIEAAVGVAGTDANGLISVAGGTALVLAGTSTVANDYYVAASFLKLYQLLISAAYQRLSKDWPQRTIAKPISYPAPPPTAAPTVPAPATTTTTTTSTGASTNA